MRFVGGALAVVTVGYALRRWWRWAHRPRQRDTLGISWGTIGDWRRPGAPTVPPGDVRWDYPPTFEDRWKGRL